MEEISYEISFSLGESQIVEGTLKIHNTVYSHRMRLAINVLDKSEKSIAQIQNGFIENTPALLSNISKLTGFSTIVSDQSGGMTSGVFSINPF